MVKRASELAPAELLAYSGEHLAYEIAMMRTAMLRPKSNDEFLETALLEIELIHARTLTDFLYPRSPKETDVTYREFFEPPLLWSPPRQSRDFLEFRDRLDREVAHLTTWRKSGTPPGKEYGNNVFVELLNALRAFGQQASPLRLNKARFDEAMQPINVVVIRDNAHSNIASSYLQPPRPLELYQQDSPWNLSS